MRTPGDDIELAAGSLVTEAVVMLSWPEFRCVAVSAPSSLAVELAEDPLATVRCPGCRR